MKTIGFIDYYISEWHANTYPARIERINKEMGEDFCIKYAYAELDVSPYDGLTTDDWCAKFGAERCLTIDELCEKADYILILAPSNPETHLRLASAALKHGKITYIDKTFAPDLATAKEIYDIADKYGTKIFSSSALRYSTELEGLTNVTEIATTGGGSNLPEYIIHQSEMVVKLLGCAPKSVKASRDGDCVIIDADFPNGHATMKYGSALPYSVSVNGGEVINIKSSYFDGLLADVLRFYVEGEPSFSREETLAVAELREKAIKCAEAL